MNYLSSLVTGTPFSIKIYFDDNPFSAKMFKFLFRGGG